MAVTCRHVGELSDSFLDGELSASLTAEVHAHLLQCPACQRQVQLLQACGDVIARDRAAPRLDETFADRLGPALVLPAAPPIPHPATLRRRSWKRPLIALPAAAALILLAVMAWPRGDTRQTFVAGVAVSGLDRVVNPAIDAVTGAQRAAQSLNQLIQLSVGDAQRGVRDRLGKEAPPSGGTPPRLSLLDVFLQPFDEIVEQPQPAQPAPAPEIVRF